MQAWIWITFAAAAAQTLRFMLQKHLSATSLSTAGATFARFLYSAPLVVVLVLAYARVSSQGLPSTPPVFWTYALTGGLCQILATLCVVALFSERNFAVGITFKKTEVLQTALVGFVILGEGLNPSAGLALALGFVGVTILSINQTSTDISGFQRLWNRAAGLGLLSGVFFAISAVGYRGASLSLGSGDVALRAGFTLAIVTSAQVVAMLIWFGLRDRQQITLVLRKWRVAGMVGIASMVGSFCWFSAFTLQNAAYVNAVGQVELILSIAASVMFFREKISLREVIGIAVLLISILWLILSLN